MSRSVTRWAKEALSPPPSCCPSRPGATRPDRPLRTRSSSPGSSTGASGRPAIIDTEALAIEEGKVWNVFVDIYVLNYDGNLFDAGTLASVAALLTAKQPRYEDGAAIREGNLQPLKTKGGMITSCTYGKVGDKLLLDPDGNEEDLMSSRLTIANDEGRLRAMQKGLSGSFTLEEVEKAIDTTFERSKGLRDIVKKAIGD